MKPEDALALLDQAVAQINGSRQLHVQLQQAIESLRALLASTTQVEKDEHS